MDTHPMVQSSDVLSDALNATFVTMNGNEIVLQNDMGNRRIDNAFLPPGYEPVGVKEYGGVIYVASYNPITNKSQIGSFPSPQKKINDDENLGGSFEFAWFTNVNDPNKNIEEDDYLGVQVLKNDAFMIPLSSDTSIRAGDKFAIYAQDLARSKSLITNYDNICYVWKEANNVKIYNGNYETFFQNDDLHKCETINGEKHYYYLEWKECDVLTYNGTSASNRKTEDGKYYIKTWSEISSNIEGRAYSPKNRMYTLQVGVLNSQNEFVDITKTLCRWEFKNNTWVPKVYEQEESETFKFNDGYFISDEFHDYLNRNSIRDSQLIRVRQKMAANTYAYKLIGPLYLKATYNHIESFNYNIYGTYDRNNYKAILYVEGFLTYNCPDGANITEPQNFNENYGTFDEGQWDLSNYPAFNLINSNSTSNGILLFSPSISQNIDDRYPIITKSVYNPSTNLYTNKIIKKYEINVHTQNTIFDYTLGVCAGDNNFNDVYIRGLSSKGSLDLSLLGSGKVTLNGWRFYNNRAKEFTTLTFSFNAYPEYGKRFGDLVFHFNELKSDGSYGETINYPKDFTLPLYNGQQTYTINWGSYLSPNKVYKVTANYKILNDDGTVDSTENLFETNDRWLLTTELFNEFYSTSKGVLDFCDPSKTSQEFNNKMIITFEGKDAIINNSKEGEKVYSGGMVSSSENISYSCENSYLVDIQSTSKFEIKNKYLYPDFININKTNESSIYINSYKVERIGSTYKTNNVDENSLLKSLLEKVKGNEYSESGQGNVGTALNNETVLDIHLSVQNNKKLTGYIKYYDWYKGYSTEGISNVSNVFGLVSDLVKHRNARPQEGFYGCVLSNFDSRNGHRDEHMIDVYHKQKLDNNTEHVTAGLKFKGLPGDQDLWEGGYRVYTDNSDSTQCISFKQVSSAVFGHWNSGLSQGQMFMYMFPGGTWYSNDQTLGIGIVINGGNASFQNTRVNGDTKARVWWRTSEGEWAQFRKLLNANQEFSNYIENQFTQKNMIYCMYDSFPGEIPLIHATNSKYIYYDKYNIPLVLNITYAPKPGISSDDLVLGTRIGIGNLNFSTQMTNIGSSSVTFDLNSSEKFQDTVRSFDKDSISNVDKVTGLDRDSKGRALNPNYFYNIETLSGGKKQLVRIDNGYMQVDFENKLPSGENTITYNKHNTIGTPEYRYDHSGDDSDDHTMIDFNSINIVSGV